MRPTLPVLGKKCCSCGLCVAKCSKKAITMELDELGFLRPFVDSTKCVGCRLCEQFCELHKPAEQEHSISCFASYSKNDSVRKSSSSGGIAHELAKSVVSQNGLVCGVLMNDKLEARYTIARTLEELSMLQGSKYMQADASEVYDLLKTELKSGRVVLFIGLPCLVQAVKTLCSGKNARFLYTVDVACHGVPSVNMFNAYVRDLKETYGDIKTFQFRDKTHGWRAYEMKVNDTCIVNSKNDFKTMFLSNFGLNDACYECKYDVSKRASDISLGDCWERNDRGEADFLGVSSVVIHTDKGKELFDSVKADVETETLNPEILFSNTGMRKQTRVVPHWNRDFLTLCRTANLSACKSVFYAWWGTERWGKKILNHYFMFPRILQYAICLIFRTVKSSLNRK